MPDPTFNGESVFGPVVVMNHDDRPNAAQINHYPGTVGIERLDLGPAERYVTVEGILAGAGPLDVAAAFQTLRDLKEEGTIGTLVDTEGASFENVIIESFNGVGRLCPSPSYGWCRGYQAKLLYLGPGPDDDEGS